MPPRGLCSDVNLQLIAKDQRFELTHFQSIGSTNDAAMAHLRSGGAGDHWFVADEQTGGRGRLGRSWSSPKGNLYASLALRDPCPMALGFQLGFVAALAIYDALQASGAEPNDLSLKWPNDVLLKGAKISGILVEGGALHDGSFGVVIGCGVNIVSHPSDTPYPATDLANDGISCAVADIFIALSSAFGRLLDVFDRGKGFDEIRNRWIRHARGIGHVIRVSQKDQVMEGIFHGLDHEGRLLLDRNGELIPVMAGDVFFEEL